MKKLTLLIIIIVTACGVWYFQERLGLTSESQSTSSRQTSNQRRPSTPAIVTVAPVIEREIVDTIESIGTTYANESVSIISKVTDTVNQVHFEDGDHVEKGDILVEMTNNEQSALLAEALANLNEARRQQVRLEDLGNKGLAADSVIDEAQSRTEAAEARFNAITARMNERLIRAPFGGKLGFREISPGTLLTSNTVVTTLDDLSIIKLDFSVPEVLLGVIEPGNEIIARSESWKDKEFKGEITNIGTRIDPISRAAIVRAIIPNQDELIRPGMLLTVKIITDVRISPVIPESAFIQIDNESFVYIAGRDGKAHKRVIEIGARKFGYVEILEGLDPGELIIIEGGFKLQDKAPYQLDEKSEMNLKLSSGNTTSWSD